MNKGELTRKSRLTSISKPAHSDEFAAAVVDFRVGQAIRKAREARGLTQSQLGDILGVQKARICGIEKGSNLTLSTIRRVFRALDMHVSLVIDQQESVELC